MRVIARQRLPARYAVDSRSAVRTPRGVGLHDRFGGFRQETAASWPVIDLASCPVRAAESLGGTGVVRRQDDEVGVALHEPQNHG
jgi:hypothetical protein